MLLLSTSDGERGAVSVLETAHIEFHLIISLMIPMFSLT